MFHRYALKIPLYFQQINMIQICFKITSSPIHLLEQSCEEAHFFRSSADNCCELCFLMDLPQPAVRVPSLENARFTIGELGTLFGLQ